MLAADSAAAAIATLTISDSAVSKQHPSDKSEQILQPNPHRFVLFPIHYHDLWQAYKNSEAKFYSAEELEMSDDLDGFEGLSRKEQSFVLQTVATLCIGCGAASEPLLGRLSDEIQVPEARCFFGFQLMQSNIHTEIFTVLFDMFTKTEQQRNDLLDGVVQLQSHARRIDWIERSLLNSKQPYVVRIVALAIYESIFLTSIRDAIAFVAGPETADLSHTVQDSHPLPGLIHAIYRVHADIQQYISFASIVKSRLTTVPDIQTVHDMIDEAVEIEKLTINDLFQLSAGNISICNRTLNKNDFYKRIEFLADNCLAQFGIPSLYGAQDSLPWIKKLHEREAKKNDRHGNHVQEIIPAQHTKRAVTIDQQFTLDADF